MPPETQATAGALVYILRTPDVAELKCYSASPGMERG